MSVRATMKTTMEATAAEVDARFLRKILFALVVATMTTGVVAAYATVEAEQAAQTLAVYGTDGAL